MRAITLLLIFMTSFVMAASSQNQEKAQNILDKVAENTKKMGAVKIIFSYSMENPEQGINESYKGEILTKGAKYRLKISGQEIISNGETVWTYIPDAEEVQVNEAGEDANEFNPSVMLSNYQEKYTTTFVKDTSVNNREMAVIKLKPQNPEEFEKAHLTIDKVKNEIYKLTIFDETGNQFSYEVVEMLPDVGLRGDEFTFDPEKHPNVSVIDMR